MQTLRAPTFFDYVLLVLLGSMFGSSFLLMKVAVETVPTITIVFFRLLVALGVLYVVMRLNGLRLPPFREKLFWRLSLLLGFTANIIPFGLITWAETEIDSGLAGIYMATIPVFSLFLAHYMTSDEKISGRKIIGVCAAFGGVFLLLWGNAGELSWHGLVAQLACLASAVFYAYSRIKTRKLSQYNPVVSSVAVLLCGTFSLLPYMLLFESTRNITPSVEAITAIVLLGIFPTAVAFVIVYKLIRDVGAVFLTSVNYLVPVFALFWGYIVLSEPITVNLLLPLAIIMVGVFFISGRKKQND